jgi:hypothetical protein
MKIYKNLTYPLKIRKSYNDSEDINVWSYKNVFYNRSVNINSLNVDSTSSINFVEPLKAKIPDITIKLGELLLIDKDTIILENVVIQNGGEMRIL